MVKRYFLNTGLRKLLLGLGLGRNVEVGEAEAAAGHHLGNHLASSARRLLLELMPHFSLLLEESKFPMAILIGAKQLGDSG